MSTTRRIYVARWPDGTATLLSAGSLDDVAALLDEHGDPGECEVTVYEGPLCFQIEPAPQPGTGYLAIREQWLGAEDPRLSLLRAAFPTVAEMIDRVDPINESELQRAWPEALRAERAREMRPSEEWAMAVSESWEEMAGVPADQTAALREQMGYSIPGQPRPAPEMRAMFEAEKRRIPERVVARLQRKRKPRAPKPDVPSK